MAVIHIDGKQHEVNGADNLLQACLSLGIDIPYFCWHPALGSVGACRQCAVKQYATPEDEAAGKGRLVMSCMTPVADNKTFISIDDDEAKTFRASVVEWLMTNHPHDCPVCEEGGHCHLQDMTVMTGHDRRRYQFTKRTHHNQYLGPFIAHEMNRCIACYRCVRFYQDYAGGTDLGVFGSAANVYFGRASDGVLESEFSGNLTEVCPTGVFTDKTHSARYNRKWDMQYAPSVCQQCATGCNTSPGERYGELRRIENRYNSDVNGYFLCDRGRFGYDYVNASSRPKQPLQKIAGELQAVSVDQALDHAITALKGKKILGIGSSRASIETNFALKQLVGADQFCSGMLAREQKLLDKTIEILRSEAIKIPSLKEIETHDAVLILGEDITQTAPRMALAVRQLAKNKASELAAARKTQDWLAEPVARIAQHETSPVYVLSVQETRLADITTGGCIASPEDIAQLGFDIAQLLQGKRLSSKDSDSYAFAQTIVQVLQAAKRPLIISGISLQNEALLEAAAMITQALENASLSLVVPDVNSMGAALLGGMPLDEALKHDFDAIVIAENNLAQRLPQTLLRQVLSKTQQVIVIDHQQTATSLQAHMVMPAASYVEGSGTVISQEGRAQRYFQVFDPSYYDPRSTVKESWRWIHALGCGLRNRAIEWKLIDDILAAIEKNEPLLSAIRDAAPDAHYRVSGLKVAREPRRYSGRTAMRAQISVHEPAAPRDANSGLTYSMEGYVGDKTASELLPFAWAPGWNSPQSWNKFQDEVGGALKGGESGIRLFDVLAKLPARSYVRPRIAKALPADRYQLLPIYDIFRSDELSAKSPVIEERAATPTLRMNAALAAKLGAVTEQMVTVSASLETVVLPLEIVEYFPDDCVGFPVGVPGFVSLGESVQLQIVMPRTEVRS